MTPAEQEARQQHPAGKQWIPKVEILERLSEVIQEQYWMYGAPTAEAPNRVERWDVRSLLDYSVLTYQIGHFRPTYTTFYLWRNSVMELMQAIAEVPNYGEWRFWETDKDRTLMDIQSVVSIATNHAREEEGNKK